MRYVIFLSLILCGSLIHASSGHNKTPVYTVDALEVNWRFDWKDGWGDKGQPVKIAKINFCQIIYWQYVNREWNKKAPRPGLKATGYTMYKVKKDAKGNNIRELEEHQDKITIPRKNHRDGYWYITLKDNFMHIEVRSKTLIGGTDGTNTFYDPEALDITARKSKRHNPMAIHKKYLKLRQDAMKVRLELHHQEGVREGQLPDPDLQQRQDDLDSLEPVIPGPVISLDLPVLNHP